jgi:hypothetical protein
MDHGSKLAVAPEEGDRAGTEVVGDIAWVRETGPIVLTLVFLVADKRLAVVSTPVFIALAGEVAQVGNTLAIHAGRVARQFGPFSNGNTDYVGGSQH